MLSVAFSSLSQLVGVTMAENTDHLDEPVPVQDALARAEDAMTDFELSVVDRKENNVFLFTHASIPSPTLDLLHMTSKEV